MSKKGEARIQRQLEKRLKQSERTVRQSAVVEDRAVRSEYAKGAPKQIRLGADPGSIFQMQMCWTVDDADREGAWSWGVSRDWGDEIWEADLRPKLIEFEKLRWAEIESHTYGNEGKRHRSHHPMETCHCCGEAQDRLSKLERAYPDILFRFRLGNLPRLWGVRVVNEFQILWYDPTHQIYPVD